VLEACFRLNAGFDWLLDLGPAASDVYILGTDEQEWLVRFRIAQAARNGGGEEGLRLELIGMLLDAGRTAEALAEWRASPGLHADPELEIRIAAANGTIGQVIARYRADPPRGEFVQMLLNVSQTLRKDGQTAAALDLLEFAYSYQLGRQDFAFANFLGLARVDLERGNRAGEAVALLRRMTLVGEQPIVGPSPFEGFELAGDLLAEFHRDAEAREFYAKAVQATPWNASAKVKLGAPAGLREVVADATASYALRAQAARKLAPSQVAVGGELALLASGDQSPDAARKPFYVEARLDAAGSTQLALLREALAIAPGDSRVRRAAILAALAAHNDALALSMYQSPGLPATGFADKDLLRALSGAAERTGNLQLAVEYATQSGAPVERLKAEMERRAENAQRAPVITDKTEQQHIVRARLTP
jgi:hypothetical protein